jgi:hypothetical protein
MQYFLFPNLNACICYKYFSEVASDRQYEYFHWQNILPQKNFAKHFKSQFLEKFCK